MGSKRVTMIALWDFRGPEGARGGVGRGIVRKGQVFIATEDRARQLLASGKASEVARPPEQARPGPERTPVDGPESFKYDELTAVQVIEKVEQGILTVSQAMELERVRVPSRSTLIARLNKMSDGW